MHTVASEPNATLLQYYNDCNSPDGLAELVAYQLLQGLDYCMYSIALNFVCLLLSASAATEPTIADLDLRTMDGKSYKLPIKPGTTTAADIRCAAAQKMGVSTAEVHMYTRALQQRLYAAASALAICYYHGCPHAYYTRCQ